MLGLIVGNSWAPAEQSARLLISSRAPAVQTDSSSSYSKGLGSSEPTASYLSEGTCLYLQNISNYRVYLDLIKPNNLYRLMMH